jgi:type I restriction enzyme S subunit
MPAICSNFMEKIEMDEQVEPSFFNYIFHALYNQKLNFPFVQQTTGIQNLKSTYYFYTNVAYPKRKEQSEIASYIDQATGTIDKVIVSKQQQIEKLEQYKKSKIHECVTIGLDADVKLKPSGIEWIGDVPEHWKVARLKDYIDFNPSSKPEDLKPDDVVTVLPMETISEDGEILRADLLPFEEVDKGLTVFKNGDVIFAKITPCMENGKGAFINSLKTKVAFGSTEFFVLRATSKSDGKFIYYITKNDEFRKLAVLSMRGAAGQQRVPSEFLKFSKFGFPKRREQKEIADYLDHFCNNISKVKNRIEQQIEKLKLYRKCLIHECITGKRKVTE